MITRVPSSDFDSMSNIINSAASAYKGVIPSDCWKEPYMSRKELQTEIERGVEFYGYYEGINLVGVMGIQAVGDVTLIRHAYVLESHQRRGIGKKLLRHLLSLVRTKDVLVGTWEAAFWAVRFYEKNDFKLVPHETKELLLRKYWKIPKRQIETSVVLEHTHN